MKFVRLETTYKNGNTSSAPFLFCTKCHSVLIFETKFCPHCGHKLNTDVKLSQIIKATDDMGLKETVDYIKERIEW